ncbi:hypothetical protein [Actinacidiphila sp. ITFR-21]|uniref:hypothetical protein n=1 Tax=Actinacidiphila sp. ITFR-21 TaxID=3075199 RepID=UPI0028896CB8|nr:hypothetical protein [Streptomyces sp. ITFR-21]WNI17476.1 hypothetical protein RLT57_19465 [Streptomyces sp. ITFR-21]
MGKKRGTRVRTGALLILGPVAAAGCSVGRGAPDGWRYLRAGEVAVAHPKSWRETGGGGAVLRGAGGRTDAALSVVPAGQGAPGAAPAPAAPTAPPDARKDTLVLDGRRARVYNYARPAPDGRPAAYVQVHVRGRDGRPLVVRAWAVDGAAHASALLPEIVNSIEFSPARLP